MSLEERSYSVLVVSSAEKLNTALSSFLNESHYHPIKIVSSVSTAKRLWNDQKYDFLIINSPLPDDTGIRFAIDAAGHIGAVVLLIIRTELYEDTFYRIVTHGVVALPKPISRQILALALGWMESARERTKPMEKKNLSVEEKMEEIRIVNRAKWVLISELKMDEPHAHRYIEKQAMDRCISRRKVAEEIIGTYIGRRGC
jgi:response regulator NasT